MTCGQRALVFQAEVMRGIQAEGVDVVDIGLVSTPLFNFACAHYSEPVLRLNLKAKTREMMEEKVKEVSDLMRAHL